MFPFKKNEGGFYQIPRYRLMQSKMGMNVSRWFLWDRHKRSVLMYFDSKAEGEHYCHDNKLEYDCG